jgi:lysophospholipase L1-like esterase
MFTSTLPLVFAAMFSTEALRPLRWEKDVAGIEKRLAGEKHDKGGVVFAGSSSIRLWNLAKSFPGQKYINAGFGGSEIRDSTRFADRLIVPHAPRAIVFYAGDNDLANKRTPEQLRDDFAAFVKHVRAKLPQTRILYLPVKPSLARLKLFEVQQTANRMIKGLCEADPLLTYVDIVPATLGTDGKPRPEFFQKDGLHLTDAGYAAWAPVVTRALEAK